MALTGDARLVLTRLKSKNAVFFNFARFGPYIIGMPRLLVLNGLRPNWAADGLFWTAYS